MVSPDPLTERPILNRHSIRHTASKVIVTCIAVLASATASASDDSVLNTLAANCPGNAIEAAPQVFATTDGKSWKSYSSRSELPQFVSDEARVAEVWTSPNATIVAIYADLAGDLFPRTYYCFSAAGRPSRIDTEVPTAWAWGYRETDVVQNGRVRKTRSEFYDLASGRKIDLSSGRDLFPIRPKVFLNLSAVPFAKLIR
jgi:hypothetical protein